MGCHQSTRIRLATILLRKLTPLHDHLLGRLTQGFLSFCDSQVCQSPAVLANALHPNYMAAMATGEGSSSDSAERLPMPSRNPLPLSASQEAQVRDIFYDRVRQQCADEIKGTLMLLLHAPFLSSKTLTSSLSLCLSAFAACALGRTFSVPFVCREPHRVMNNCMKQHATPREQDAAREEWFAQRQERVKAKIEKQRRKEEQARFVREWWGLEESEREAQIRRLDEEKLKKGERVGGYRPAPRPVGEEVKK